MKKISGLLSILFMGILLGGCVSIGLSDGSTLEISEDGVKVIAEEESEGDESDGSLDVEKGGNDEASPVQGEEDDEGGVIPEADEEEGEEEFLTDEGHPGCEIAFYLLHFRIVDGFPIMPCPEFRMIEVNKLSNQRDVRAIYEVHYNLYYEYNQYLDFFESNGYTLQNDYLKAQVGIMEASDQNMQMNLGLTAGVNGRYDETTVEMTYSESPARHHPIVDSILNREDTSSFGKCDDEFYVLKNYLIAGFPFDECIEISFLSIVFDDETPSVNAVYTTSGTIEELAGKYADFFSNHGNIWETNYEGIDDADATTIAEVNGNQISIKYVEMENGRIGIQLFYEAL